MEHIADLKPEMASFDAGTFNWMPTGVFSNSPDFLRKLARVLTANEVKPEIEVFDSGMIHTAVYFLEKEQLLKGPLHFQFVLGVLGAAEATVENLVHLRNKLPEGCTWAGMGVGLGHLPILFATLAMGGHIRVGLEDNLYYAKGRLASNEELVARAVRLIKENNSTVASPDDARNILGLRNHQ
jgi:uncharacterized protein (DUF849 family)